MTDSSPTDDERYIEDDERRALFDMIPQITLMVRELFRNPSPLLTQPGIVKKLNFLNYVLAEWNDQYERMEEQKKKQQKL